MARWRGSGRGSEWVVNVVVVVDELTHSPRSSFSSAPSLSKEIQTSPR